VKKPNARVVCDKGDDEVSTLSIRPITRHESHIPTRWVLEIQLNTAIVATITTGEDVEVVAMKMDRMSEGNLRLDDDIDPFSEIWNFDGEIATVIWHSGVVVYRIEGGIVPVGLERSTIEIPPVQVLGVGVRDGNTVVDGEAFCADVHCGSGDKIRGQFVFAST